MKKSLVIFTLSLFSTGLFSQVYNLQTVYKNQSTLFLSHWVVVEVPTDSIKSDTFSLWGYQKYGESWVDNAYEVEYFKGNAKDTYRFLNELIKFRKKYNDKENYVTYIQGVKVKSQYFWKRQLLLVFDKEGKVAVVLDEKMITTMFNNFIQYCEKNNIAYQ